MGSTGIYQTTPKTRAEIKDFITGEIVPDGNKIVAMMNYGNEWYVAVERTVSKKEFESNIWFNYLVPDFDDGTNVTFVTALIFAIKANTSQEFIYKVLQECVHPIYYNVNKKFLSSLSKIAESAKTDINYIGNAFDWREQCKKNIEEKALIKSLKTGDKIKLRLPARFTTKGVTVTADEFMVYEGKDAGFRAKLVFWNTNTGFVRLTNWAMEGVKKI